MDAPNYPSQLKAMINNCNPSAGISLLNQLKKTDPKSYTSTFDCLLKILGRSLSSSSYLSAWLVLIKHHPRWLTGNPEPARQLAATVEHNGPFKARADLIVALASLPEVLRWLALEHCQSRDELIAHLLDQQAFGEVLSLLRASLDRWTPESGTITDLIWLMDLLVATRQAGTGTTAVVTVLTSGGPMKKSSRMLLEAIGFEACAAASRAWLRCLRGPAGSEHCRLLPNPGVDPVLREELEATLASDPAALALALEEGILEHVLTEHELKRLIGSGINALNYCSKIFEGRN